MEIREIVTKALERLEKFNLQPILPALRACNDGALADVYNTNGCAYYQFAPCLMEEVKPKQVVELGGAMGVWDLMVLNSKYQDFELYSITLPENGLEFSYIIDKYKNFHPIIGDDLDLKNWGDLDLSQTDIWFLDSAHTTEQLTKELELYTPYFKKGSILIFDDIRMPEIWPVWKSLSYDKMEVTNPLHYSGYGFCLV